MQTALIMTLQRYLERLIWLSILPPVLLGSVLVFAHLHTLEERRQMLADSVVRSAARNLDQKLEVWLASLALLGRLVDEEVALNRGQLDLLRARRVAEQYRELLGHQVVLGNESGEMLFTTRLPPGEPLPRLPRPEGRSAVDVALVTGAPAVGDPFAGRSAEHQLVALAAPLKATLRGRLVVLTTVDVDLLRQRLEPYQLPKTWSLRVQDSTHRTLLRIGPRDGRHTGEDEAVPVHRAALSQAPWTILLSAPPTSPLDSAVMQSLLLLLTLGATVLLAYGGGRLASRRLTRSIGSLANSAPASAGERDIDEVSEVRRRLRELALQRELAQEAERRRLGLELHDDLQQKLAVLRHEVAAIPAAPSADGPDEQESSAQTRRRALDLVDETLESTRRMIRDLRPSALDDLGLPAALQSLAGQHQSFTGQRVDVRLIDETACEHLPDPVATALYRMTQEALNNVRKHAQATTVNLCLDAGTPGLVILEVVDDGVGLGQAPAGGTAEGNGLRGIRERVALLGGTLEILSQPLQGTALVLRIPLVPATPP